jgi:hypothetical protein
MERYEAGRGDSEVRMGQAMTRGDDSLESDFK